MQSGDAIGAGSGREQRHRVRCVLFRGPYRIQHGRLSGFAEQRQPAGFVIGGEDEEGLTVLLGFVVQETDRILDDPHACHQSIEILAVRSGIRLLALDDQDIAAIAAAETGHGGAGEIEHGDADLLLDREIPRQQDRHGRGRIGGGGIRDALGDLVLLREQRDQRILSEERVFRIGADLSVQDIEIGFRQLAGDRLVIPPRMAVRDEGRRRRVPQEGIGHDAGAITLRVRHFEQRLQGLAGGIHGHGFGGRGAAGGERRRRGRGIGHQPIHEMRLVPTGIFEPFPCRPAVDAVADHVRRGKMREPHAVGDEDHDVLRGALDGRLGGFPGVGDLELHGVRRQADQLDVGPRDPVIHA